MRHGGGRRDNGLSNWWLLGFRVVGVDLVGFGGWWLIGHLFFLGGFVGVGSVIRVRHGWWSPA